VQNVFKPYSIQVNERHLSLLADYLTCEGVYQGFNRAAITSIPSPLQKITFETCMTFLVNACLENRPDHLQSPSARLVAGQIVSCGTGCFDILQPLIV
jgi:DNA-directed RNA polymerase I subunit RPA1